MRVEFDKRRKTMVERLREIPGVTCVEPKGAFYAFPDLSAFVGKKTPEGKTIENDVQLCEWLIEAARSRSCRAPPSARPASCACRTRPR